jgi:Cd2+/Zn2+-exporting ATPase
VNPVSTSSHDVLKDQSVVEPVETTNDSGLDTDACICLDHRSPGTRVYVSVDGVYAGCITIADEVKPDARDAISLLKKRNIRQTVMLSGDSPQICAAIAAETGIDLAYGGLLPAEKVEKVEALEQELTVNTENKKRRLLSFVGDGINDAPVLARSDIGIAMGALGSDAAIEAADIVIMTDEPSKVAEAVDIAAATKRVVTQNIVFALGVKGAVLVLGAFGLAAMWAAVFADVGVALLAVLNSTRLLRKG